MSASRRIHSVLQVFSRSYLGVLLCLLFHLYIFFPSTAQTFSLQQDLRFENFNTPGKIITGSAGNLMTDTRGYVWICSDGLYRFDGWNTTKYNSADNSGRGLLNNYCDDLVNDQYGRLWIGNLEGLCYYDSRSDSIIYLQKNTANPILFAFSFYIKDQELWFVCNLGLCTLDLKTLEVKTTSLTEIKDPTGTYELSGDELGISSRESFYIYNTNTETYRKKLFTVNNSPVQVNDIERKGIVFWVATNRGLMTTTDFTSLEPVRGSMPVYISSLLFHPRDREKKFLWLGTARSGLQVFNIETFEQAYQYRHHDLAPFSIPSDNIYSLTSQKNGNIWIGTEKGISLLQIHNQTYQSRLLTFDNSSTDNHIGLSVQDKFDTGVVWFACQYQGLLAVNWATKEVMKQYKNMTVPGTGLSVLDMLQLNQDKWLLLYPFKLAVWSKHTGIEKIAIPSPSLNNPTTFRFNKLINGDSTIVYITSNRGLISYDLNTNQLIPLLQRSSSDATYYSPLDLQNGFIDKNGDLWLASRNGLVLYETYNKQHSVFQHNPGKAGLQNFLYDVAPGVNGDIYCGGLDGITVFNAHTKNFNSVDFDGIKRLNSFTLFRDTNTIWSNTNAGLLMVDLKKNVKRRYIIPGPSDNYSFSDITRIQNELVIGFRDAYAYLPLSVIDQKEKPGSPVIENVFVNNQPYPLHDTTYSLKYFQNDIRVIFTAFEYTDAASIRFRYKLSGIEDEWNYTGKERSIQFVRLPPGNYKLLIQAGNNAGWNETGTELDFNIKPAFWQTWWFRALVIGLTVTMAFILLKRRVSNIRRQAAIRQGMAELEMKALRAQMNPHFIFNCMATADGLILQNKKIEASEFLHKFSQLVRQVLENSMHSLISIQRDLDPLHLYIQLEQVRNQYRFTYEIIIDEDVDPTNTCIPPLLIQPFVENAILHGLRHRNDDKGLLKVCFKKAAKSLICTVDDNGVGRKQSALINKDRKSGHSLGLKVTESRVETMRLIYGKKQSINIIDKDNDNGTQVVITLPLMNNCF